MSIPSAIDSEFALLHGLSPETVRVFVDLAPYLSTRSDAPAPLAHPASAPLHPGMAQDCFRLRYEAAERRYARMKGLVHASLEAQQRMERESRGLRVADRIVQMGLETECAATLAAVPQRGSGISSMVASVALQDDIDGLTSRLAAALELNEKLMSMNRELRGLQGLEPASAAMAVEWSDPTVESLTAEVETLRRQIILLELECTRLQSASDRFELDERLRECLLVAVPSIWDEPFGLVAAEAHAAARAVLATRTGALPEIVQDGETGWLVPPGDPLALASVLRSVAEDPAIAVAHGQRARARAEQQFGWDGCVTAYERLYERLAVGGGR